MTASNGSFRFGWVPRVDVRVEVSDCHGAAGGSQPAYYDANLKPLKWLAVRGGVHADLLTYDVLNNCAVQSVAHPSKTNPPGDSSCLSQQDFGYYREPVQESTTSGIAVMPRATVIAGPFEGFNLTASGGQAVRSL